MLRDKDKVMSKTILIIQRNQSKVKRGKTRESERSYQRKKDTRKECQRGGIFAYGENTRTLRLTSELVELRVE